MNCWHADLLAMNVATNIQDVSKRALQLWKLKLIYPEDVYSILNCHNLAKHTKFYLG
jgi:hypothetical protein